MTRNGQEVSIARRVIETYKKIWFNDHLIIKKDVLPTFEVSVILDICHKAINILKDKPIIQHISFPVIVVGDLHGNISDLFRILRLFDNPPDEQYLFLGDYVDRGDFSFHVIFLLLALFVENPNHVTLLRGNHEFENINHTYGFYTELNVMFDDRRVYGSFNEVFAYLPLIAILGHSAICLHGGLSPRFKSLGDIQHVQRPLKQINAYPAVADILWSDPSDEIYTYDLNYRGSGYVFGETATREFLQRNNLKVLIRAHQFILNGAQTFAKDLGLTVFSSSGYSGSYSRSGVVKIDKHGNCYVYSLSKDTNRHLPKPMMVKISDKMGFIQPNNDKVVIRFLHGELTYMPPKRNDQAIQLIYERQRAQRRRSFEELANEKVNNSIITQKEQQNEKQENVLNQNQKITKRDSFETFKLSRTSTPVNRSSPDLLKYAPTQRAPLQPFKLSSLTANTNTNPNTNTNSNSNNITNNANQTKKELPKQQTSNTINNKLPTTTKKSTSTIKKRTNYPKTLDSLLKTEVHFVPAPPLIINFDDDEYDDDKTKKEEKKQKKSDENEKPKENLKLNDSSKVSKISENTTDENKDNNEIPKAKKPSKRKRSGKKKIKKGKKGKKCRKSRRKKVKGQSLPKYKGDDKLPKTLEFDVDNNIISDPFESDSETIDTFVFNTMPGPILPSPVKPKPHRSQEIIDIPFMPPLPDEEILLKRSMTPQERFRYLLSQ